ncbi:MAG: hypothetical protein PHY46_01620 [Candidatus Omnitrophica bacterium]|nr:hypothetical protein [Candidatus Omnitrophota bacterium]
MHKSVYRLFFLLLAAVFILCVCAGDAICASSSTAYEAVISAGSGGVFTSLSTTYNGKGSVSQIAIGSSGSTGSSASGTLGFDVGLGFLWAIEAGLPSIAQEYDLYDLRAFSYATKEEIFASTWQRYNDPYFTWKMKVKYPITLVLGYSVSIDVEPDDIIDTQEMYYNGFAASSLSDGKHTFYVKAATTGGIWGETEGFEFWIDTKAPQADNLSPAIGQVVTDNMYPLSLDLSDATSGIDESTISLYIDNGPLSFDFEDGHLTATPVTPYNNGSVTAHIQAKDLAGNSLNMAWGFIVDANLPVGLILINGGEESTPYARVRLNLEAEDETTEISQMILSNDGIFDTEAWEDFTALRTDWILANPQEVGEKTVYCMFKDDAGNISSVYSDDIILIMAAIDTLITTGPYSPTKETGAQFKYQSTFQNALFSYKLDSDEWSEWSSTAQMSLSGLEPGNHIFSVKSSKDLNGDEEITEEEEDPIPAQWTWVIQTEETPARRERTLYWRTE